VVAIGSGFISLYPIQDLKMHHKKLVLPLHRIKMAWDDISQPIFDRGFNWMVVLCMLEYLLIRLPQDPDSPPRIVTLGHDVVDDGPGWVSGLTRSDAALTMCRDSTAKIITYSWDVEMKHCAFRIKYFTIPGISDCSKRLFNTGLDMASGRLIFIDHHRDQRRCIVFDTVPPVVSVDNTSVLL